MSAPATSPPPASPELRTRVLTRAVVLAVRAAAVAWSKEARVYDSAAAATTVLERGLARGCGGPIASVWLSAATQQPSQRVVLDSVTPSDWATCYAAPASVEVRYHFGSGRNPQLDRFLGFLLQAESPLGSDEQARELSAWLDARQTKAAELCQGVLTPQAYDELAEEVVPDACVRAILRAEQGTDLWLKSRRFFVTGSVLATLLGHNPYEPDLDAAVGRLFAVDPTPEKHDERTLKCFKHGHDHEPDGLEALREHLRGRDDIAEFEVHTTGLYVTQFPGFAFSPDGVVCQHMKDGTTEWWGVEIKCPALRRKPYDALPCYYEAQVQALMGFLGFQRCYFVVWTEARTTVTQVALDEAFFFDEIAWRARAAVRAALQRLGGAPPAKA